MKKAPRRDLCVRIGLRMGVLSDAQSIRAWRSLAIQIEALGDKDIPKFRDLVKAIYTARIKAVRT